MKVEQKIIDRFDTFLTSANEILESDHIRLRDNSLVIMSPSTSETLDTRVIGWKVSVLNLLEKILDTESIHYKELSKIADNIQNPELMYEAIEILKAAKADYESGYLFDTRVLIEAEVFGDFLEQAEHLLSQGYFQPAAVIAGSVLEDGLRKLCARKGILLQPKATINPMNDALAKAGVYNKLTQKRITALADIRNSAAHGKWTEFSEKDVEDMIRDVRRFMEDHFS